MTGELSTQADAMKPLPAYGKQWLADPPGAGLHVAIGPGAWQFAKSRPYLLVVLPPENIPADFRWPAHRGGAVLHERGIFDDSLLEATATALLNAGCPYVVALREALMDTDPRVYFEPGVDHAAA